MGRLVDVAVDDLVERQAEPLARRFAGNPAGRRATAADPTAASVENESAALSALQNILLGTDRDQMQLLAQDLDSLRRQFSDKDALAAAVAPVLGDAIRRQIQESREEIIDALYPVIGQIVVRAVTEAIRDLARSIDERLQAATDFQKIGQRLRARFTGISVGELALRSGLPFVVQEIYLIHRESGLLLWHTSRSAQNAADADLVGAMLTAIREFADQVLGEGEDQLHKLQMGKRELLLEFGRYSYVGVVIDGVVTSDFRWKLYQRIYAFEKNVRQRLQRYDGDAAALGQAARSEFESFLSIPAEISR
ncbi:MAG: hypothetical protein DWI57_10430 [Chloroflexi bacterium]|nr:MAG: hypothetical protein DWI57_10430 [Chloroflexota bacterium]